jgi:hypothetical protein
MNVIHENGWKRLTFSFLIKILNIFQMQAKSLGKYYTICQNAIS